MFRLSLIAIVLIAFSLAYINAWLAVALVVAVFTVPYLFASAVFAAWLALITRWSNK